MLSTLVGGGIVGLPYAFLHFGIPIAVVIVLFVIWVTKESAEMYLEIKNLIPDQPESLFEIAYMLYGRKQIFVLSVIITILSFGLCMVYFIVFGDTMAQFIGHLIGEKLGEGPWSSRYTYVLILAVLLIPVVLKKELAELKVLSYILFGCLGIFILLNLVQLLFDKHFDIPPVEADYFEPTFNVELIEALSILLVAFSYQQNVFPIYSSLKNKTDEEFK